MKAMKEQEEEAKKPKTRKEQLIEKLEKPAEKVLGEVGGFIVPRVLVHGWFVTVWMLSLMLYLIPSGYGGVISSFWMMMLVNFMAFVAWSLSRSEAIKV